MEGESVLDHYVTVGSLQIAEAVYRFVEDEALPGSGVDSERFWEGADRLVHAFAPRNLDLLTRRVQLQTEIDDYHRRYPGKPASDYVDLLTSSGYLVAEPDEFEITTTSVDPELSDQAGPQLVVPLSNARFAVNAANARWGSLYDALYGTDAIDERDGREQRDIYNPVRGAAVIARGRELLDKYFPLGEGSHAAASHYGVDDKGLYVINDEQRRRLAAPAAFVGYRGRADSPEAVLFVHHGLHVEVQLDRTHPIGAKDLAGVKDIVLEAAVSTIMDLEDSVAAVDATDKVASYRNWLHLMQGRLSAPVDKGGRSFIRRLNRDRTFTTREGASVTMPGRSLLLIRHVGLLMTTDAVRDRNGRDVPEGLLDALIATLASIHDLRGNGELRNSRTNSIYVVKPKLHGPEEVQFTCDVFAEVERILNLPGASIKLGIMDEERRTSVNLRACVFAARDRVVFINTGFLDRTGDDIHTSMLAGPMVRKADMRTQPWIHAYEDNNVSVGLACGFAGRAQIGKGMWPAPDNLAEMMAQKIAHPMSGATCAWVPSPTAATLHALHYHDVDVAQRQQELRDRPAFELGDLLTVPLVDPATLLPEAVQDELDNNIQGVLGYVVRWVDSGVGCSKVPDIHGTPRMEDRATCRISSQHVANWLLHGVVSAYQVDDSLCRMAAIVDAQNANNAGYMPMAPSFDGPAFAAARALIYEAQHQPNGYTEPTLHRFRRIRKSAEPISV